MKYQIIDHSDDYSPNFLVKMINDNWNIITKDAWNYMYLYQKHIPKNVGYLPLCISDEVREKVRTIIPKEFQLFPSSAEDIATVVSIAKEYRDSPTFWPELYDLRNAGEKYYFFAVPDLNTNSAVLSSLSKIKIVFWVADPLEEITIALKL